MLNLVFLSFDKGSFIIFYGDEVGLRRLCVNVPFLLFDLLVNPLFL